MTRYFLLYTVLGIQVINVAKHDRQEPLQDLIMHEMLTWYWITSLYTQTTTCHVMNNRNKETYKHSAFLCLFNIISKPFSL